MVKTVQEATSEMQDSISQIVKAYEKTYGLTVNEIVFSSVTINDSKKDTIYLNIGSYKTYEQ